MRTPLAFRALPLLTASLLLVTSPVLAQQEGGSGPRRVSTPAPAMTYDAIATKGPVVSFNFRGGTIAEFAGALRGASDKPVNIAVARQASAIELPPISMQSVYLQDALEAIRYVAELPPGPIVMVENLSRGMVGQAETTPAFAITIQGQERRPVGEKNGTLPRQVMVFSIAELLESGSRRGEKPETVLGGIEATLQMVDPEGGEEPEIRFHQDSGLLIVKAAPQTIGLVQQAISEMRGNIERRTTGAERAQKESIQNEARIRTAQINAELAKQRAERIKAELEQARAEGSVPTAKLREGEMQALEAQADYERAVVELESLKKMAEVSGGTGRPPATPATPAKLPEKRNR